MSPCDSVFRHSIALSLESVLVKSHLVGDELCVHLFSIHDICLHVEEFMGNFSFNFNLLQSCKRLIHGFAV